MLAKDISQAFLYHLQWKTRLRDFIDGKGDFNISEISPEGCTLGKWLCSDDIKQYISDAEIDELVSAHNELHETARRVYDLKISGQSDSARQDLGNMVKSSLKICSLLSALKIISDSQNLIVANTL